jgi:hypothetical protein
LVPLIIKSTSAPRCLLKSSDKPGGRTNPTAASPLLT